MTYAGDRSVFSSIVPGLVSVLPTEAVEWKKSYGRNSRQVYVRISFQPFTAETVARQFFLKSYNKFLNNFEAGEEQPLLAGFQKLSFL